jgi:peptidoglycan hydrolase-like protein with peptidoglycan-binding domain
MTIFGPDLASFEAGIDLSRVSDCAFVLAKATESTWYVDPPYDGWHLAAAALGTPFVPYHFLVAGAPVAAQAAWFKSRVGDPALPAMLDVESEGASQPALPDILAFLDAAKALGLRFRLVYLPRWYWARIGSPDLAPLAARGLALVSSGYPHPSAGSAAATYAAGGGDAGEGWAPYGGMTPALWQFADDALEGGHKVDMNAFRGSTAQLAAFLGQGAPSPVPGGPRTLVQGDSGPDVKALQTELNAKGFPCGAVDAVFGPLTREAVVAFQTDHIAAVRWVDGQFGPLTRAALDAAPPADPWPGVFITRGSTGPLVKRVQAALRRAAYNPGAIDGFCGKSTSLQISAYQRDHAASCGAPDGVVGPLTWRSLRP